MPFGIATIRSRVRCLVAAIAVIMAGCAAVSPLSNTSLVSNHKVSWTSQPAVSSDPFLSTQATEASEVFEMPRDTMSVASDVDSATPVAD